MPESAAQSHNWTIIGANSLAAMLRAAAPFRPAPRPVTIATAPDDVPADAFVLGPAALETGNERVIPWYVAFEAVEEVERALRAGEAGRVYGCFASYRLPRSEPAAHVKHNALLPVVATALYLLDREPRRVWAQRAALLQPDDAWFVTLTLDDETIVTLEALAVTEPAAGPELLIEVTASERVLRAEPMRQAVVVERVGAAPAAYPWWENTAERYLAAVLRQADQSPAGAGTRLRTVWDAIERSAESGAPVTVG